MTAELSVTDSIQKCKQLQHTVALLTEKVKQLRKKEKGKEEYRVERGRMGVTKKGKLKWKKIKEEKRAEG